MQKVVDKYAYDETLVSVDNGVQMFVGENKEIGQKFFLKRFRGKTSENKKRYQALLNEANILKHIKHSQIYKCHKMLRTSNNVYLVFDYFEGETLENFSKAYPNSAKSQRLELLLKILDLIKVLIQSTVVHCNINPANILINKQFKPTIINFSYAHLTYGEEVAKIIFEPPQSLFGAPQIYSQMLFSRSSDLFSFGMICKFLLHDVTKLLSKEFSNMLQKLVNQEQYRLRPNVHDIEESIRKEINSAQTQMTAFGHNNCLIQSQKNVSQNEKSLRQAKSDRNFQKHRKNISQISPTKKIPSVEEAVSSILKKRAFAVFLLEISNICFQILTEETPGLLAGFKLMILSTEAIQQAYQMLKTHENMSAQGKEKISRADSFKLDLCLRRQSTSQRKKVNDILEVLNSELNFSEQQFLMPNSESDITLESCIKQLLQGIFLENPQTANLKKAEIIYLYILSEMMEYDSPEQMFWSRPDIHDSELHCYQLADQSIYKNLYLSQQRELINKIKKKLI